MNTNNYKPNKEELVNISLSDFNLYIEPTRGLQGIVTKNIQQETQNALYSPT